MSSPKIVLYNPSAVFFTFPLALVALGSALDRERYEVVIIDGRLDRDRLFEELEDAAVLGITVLTGEPIRDALEVSRRAKALRPDLLVVWGGWHPSLFPEDTLREPSVDATVQGQGEVTFSHLVEAHCAGEGLDGVEGLCFRSDGQVVRNPARTLVAMETLPAHDYGMIPVERYFELKGKRQLDYISSTGCPFRCSFCADPFVFGRKWTAVSPSRMGEEMEFLHERYRFDELAFQDETFFTYRDRVVEIAEEILSRDLRFRWTATLRADQADRLSEEDFATCVRSGLSRVMIGVEAGTQAMLDWMKKDIKIEQVLAAADLCRRHGVGGIFPFIVGFPGESEKSIQASLDVARHLRSLDPDFDTPIFFFKPYPGSEITDEAVRQGHVLPDSLEEWADFDFIGSSGPWLSPETEERVERFKFYNRFAGGRENWIRWPLQQLSRWRCRHRFFSWPLEQRLVESLWPSAKLS